MNTPAQAQTHLAAGQTYRLEWNQAVTQSPPDPPRFDFPITALRFEMRLNGGTPVEVTGVACPGTLPNYICTTPPQAALASGTYTAEVRAFAIDTRPESPTFNQRFESAWHSPVTFIVDPASCVNPDAPTGLRILPGV